MDMPSKFKVVNDKSMNTNSSTTLFIVFIAFICYSLVFLIESGEAREAFGGKLTPDFIVEKLGNSNFSGMNSITALVAFTASSIVTDRHLEIKQLDLPQSLIRGVELNNQFLALKCVNLEHNQLTSFSGLIHLPNLKVVLTCHENRSNIVHI
jgi:hypothetical protein